MTLKLTYANADALFNLFNNDVLINHPVGLDSRLIMLHMVSIYKKLRAKWEGERRKTYNLNVSHPEAVAYYIYWRDNGISPGAYEWSFILNHCNQIDRELNNTRIIHTNTNLLN